MTSPSNWLAKFDAVVSEREIERLTAELDAAVREREEYNGKHQAACLEIDRLRAAAKPFADHDWYDAELEDDNCQLTRHSGPVTVGHWKALRAALASGPA